jgi:hypothetical protein
MVGGNQGLSFLGAVANADDELISRVRLTSGAEHHHGQRRAWKSESTMWS